jgi:hypothetical protein
MLLLALAYIIFLKMGSARDYSRRDCSSALDVPSILVSTYSTAESCDDRSISVKKQSTNNKNMVDIYLIYF